MTEESGVNSKISLRATMAYGAAALLFASACASGPHSDHVSGEDSCTTTYFAGPFAHVDACSAEQGMVAGIQAAFAEQVGAGERADERTGNVTNLMDAALSERWQAIAPMLLLVDDSQRQRWHSRSVHLTTRAHVTSDDRPPGTDTTQARVLAVELVPSDSSPSIGFTVYAKVSRADSAAPWRISGLEVRG